jgi:hypothetical protein
LMQTTDLIDRLAADLRPIPERAAWQGLVIALAVGSVVALGALWVCFGPRKDFASALLTFSLWMKWAYALGVSAAAFSLCARLARPEGAPGALPLVLGMPFLVLGAMALIEISGVPADERRVLWLGRTALMCPWTIAALAIPIFIAALWALRRLAPTRQRWAGFSAGCLAGAVAAALYAIQCREAAATFVISWYTAGILLPGLVGMLIGPRVLRW